jgi:GT2 family glycosyltransferase
MLTYEAVTSLRPMSFDRGRFSVVIPTRAREQSLARCLGPLRASIQGGAAEIIVTDDGAGDTTRDMLASSFPDVTWTRGPARGPAANRNHGASLARGEFVLFIDDDVIPTVDLLASYDPAIRSDVDVYEGKTTCHAGLSSPLETAPVNENGGWLWSCNVMVRRSFWESFGGFDEDFRFPHLEDVVLREQLKAAGVAIQFVPGASVDHPPRRIPSAAARVPIHESDFIYQYKYLKRRPSMARFVRDHLRHYARIVVERPKSIDSLIAIGSVLQEIGGVLRRWRAWDAKYRDLSRDGAAGD